MLHQMLRRNNTFRAGAQLAHAKPATKIQSAERSCTYGSGPGPSAISNAASRAAQLGTRTRMPRLATTIGP
jgi:hypothetical protein